jgi:hypothetical protein
LPRARGGVSVEFHNERGTCVAPALRAEYVAKGGEKTPGCWRVLSRAVVQVAFMDGDFLQLPADLIKPPKSS